MMKRKDSIVKTLTGGVEGLFRKNKIKLVRGLGRITDAHTVTVDTGRGQEVLRAEKIVVATGSVPTTLPIPGLEIGGNCGPVPRPSALTRSPRAWSLWAPEQ